MILGALPINFEDIFQLVIIKHSFVFRRVEEDIDGAQPKIQIEDDSVASKGDEMSSKEP